LTKKATIEEAFNTILRIDMTHSLPVPGACQKAYEKFVTSWKKFQSKDTKAVAIWSAIKEYVTQFMEENETIQKEDHCLRFIRHLSSQIVNKENPDLIKTSLPNFSKALLQTGLQYLEGGYDNVPCVKALEAMGTYSKEIGAWISKVLAINPKEEEITIGGLDWGLDEKHDEL